MTIDHTKLIVFPGVSGTSKQSFHMEDIDVIITGKSSGNHHIEVMNIGFLPKGFKAYQTHHFSPITTDQEEGAGTPEVEPPSDPVKYPFRDKNA